MDSQLADLTSGTNPELKDATWRVYKKHLSSLPAHYGSLASSILMIGCIHTLTCRCMPSASGSRRRHSSNDSFHNISSLHRQQENDEIQPGPRKCNCHANKTSTQFVRQVTYSYIFQFWKNRWGVVS